MSEPSTERGGERGGEGGGERAYADLDLPLQPSRILIAEDEHLVATDLTQTLSELGFITVGPVADGEAALKLARLAMPDMALLDIRMPKRDGLSVARELFEELRVPAVIVSAYSDGEYVDAAAVAGVFGYIIKPALGDQLRVTLAVAWSRYRQHALQREEAQLLRRKLDDRKTIEQAKWILVSRKTITEPEALKMLQTRARESRQTLAEVARALIAANSLL